MSSSKAASSSTAKGYEPQAKKQKLLLSEADRAEQHLAPNQPGRVQLNKISWHHNNRERQGIMPFHAQDVAYDICTRGTSKRRYGVVRLVEVPENVTKSWLAGIETKHRMNSLLSNFRAMSHNGQMYATLRCTHFVEAQKLIKEGGRRYMNKADGLHLQLKDDDREGQLIQEQGVEAIVYSATLWDDKHALLAIMQEDNLDAAIAKSETELDAFGHVSRVVSELSAGYQQQGKILKSDEVLY